MNLTIDSKHTSPFNRIKSSVVLGACGMALAVSAVVAAPWQSGASDVQSTPAAVRTVSASEIMAGVMSSERANFIFEAPEVAPTRKVADADLMASIISSERATYVFQFPAATSRQLSNTDLMDSVISSERATYFFAD